MSGHNGTPLRGLDVTAMSSVSTGKFGRMFRWLAPAFDSDITKIGCTRKMLGELATLMTTSDFADRAKKAKTPDANLWTPDVERENRLVPAGYTYLGQFIDHDITFDPASSLQKQNDPNTIEDFRTPRLDLDCLYGRGPEDQPYLFLREVLEVDDEKDRSDEVEQGGNKGDLGNADVAKAADTDVTEGSATKTGAKRCVFLRAKFRTGLPCGVPGQTRYDLPRDIDGTAIIGDKRNDQNKIVSQVHTLFMTFHNKVFDALRGRYKNPADPRRFLETQRIVRWSYQWIILQDFLPRVCDSTILGEILPPDRRKRPRLRFFKPKSGQAYIPVEFAAAAYRFGHSMIRPSYALNEIATASSKFRREGSKEHDFARIPVFIAEHKRRRDSLAGFAPLPEHWGIDWNFFFGECTFDGKAKQIPQPSSRIDTRLVESLASLPEFRTAPAPSHEPSSLTARNLLRSYSLSLPSGQSVARAIGEIPLTEEQLWHVHVVGDGIPNPWSEGSAFYERYRALVEGCAPLWFYILKEAEVLSHGLRLGPVGTRIVAETIVGLAWYDHFSYLFQFPRWTPAEEGIPGLDEKLDMLKLTQFVG